MKTPLPLLIVALAFLSGCAQTEDRGSGVQSLPLGVDGQIYDAAPDRATTKPLKRRRLLIFSLPTGQGHTSTPWAVTALIHMGEKTGAFEPVASDDLGAFEPESLAGFDAIFLVHTTREFLMPRPDVFKNLSPQQQRTARERGARLKKNLVSFVANGGGLAGLHGAGDTSAQWPEFREILGASYDGHPWNDPNEMSTLRVEEPGHALCAAFEGSVSFRIRDEIYQFKPPYSRNNLRVLLSLDLSKTQTTRPYTRKNMRRKDRDYPVAWVRRHRKGRVFYCSLGHSEKIFLNPTIMRFYLDGIQYVLGDLSVDDSPRTPERTRARK